MEEIPRRGRGQVSIDSEPRVQLGTGGFGSVFEGGCGGRPVAVRRVWVQNCNRNEEEAMKQLNHPNIVKLFHCESDKDFGSDTLS